ncbi:MAG: transcription antitermination factor NusB [Clostridiales bacterium]|jgi:N utilization substance protein B|nr:transcription antitermination factor NusB [Clostridiales bacterium]
MRKLARATAFKLIFSYLFQREKDCGPLTDQELLGQEWEKFRETDKEYALKVYEGVIEKYDELYANIAALSSDFRPERIFKVDLAIMLLAMYEIDYMHDIPDIVAINEAVELAKAFSTEKSPSFINGILATHLKKKKGEG